MSMGPKLVLILMPQEECKRVYSML